MSTLPTIGRIMHYYTRHPGIDNVPEYRGPLAAMVSDVHDDGESISACVFESSGLPTIAEKIPVVQPEYLDAVWRYNELKEFVCWMPYQVSKHAEEQA